MANIVGTNFDDSLVGTSFSDEIIALGGNDVLLGGDGDDFLDGGFGFDTINGGNGNDTTSYAFYSGPIVANLTTGVVGFPGNSLLTDTLISIENVIGTNGNDSITGNNDANVLSGRLGNDTLNGGLGRDTMTGGAGNDIFVYNRTTESPAGSNRDVITDFQRGFDKIDLSAIDANPFNAFLSFNPNDAFTWKGLNGLISGIGQVRYIQSGANLLLQANTDFNFGNFELEIQLNALSSFSSTDVIL